MTKVAAMNMSVREFLEEAYRPRSESRPDLAAQAKHNRMMRFLDINEQILEQERHAQRQWLIFGGMLFAFVVVALLFASAIEQHHMTPSQQQTISHIIN